MRPITPARGATFLCVFGMPMLLALVSAIGLASALLGDGIWNVLSWVALDASVAVIVWHVVRPRGAATDRAGLPVAWRASLRRRLAFAAAALLVIGLVAAHMVSLLRRYDLRGVMFEARYCPHLYRPSAATILMSHRQTSDFTLTLSRRERASARRRRRKAVTHIHDGVFP
jgi:hypothetical protein